MRIVTTALAAAAALVALAGCSGGLAQETEVTTYNSTGRNSGYAGSQNESAETVAAQSSCYDMVDAYIQYWRDFWVEEGSGTRPVTYRWWTEGGVCRIQDPKPGSVVMTLRYTAHTIQVLTDGVVVTEFEV